MSKDKLFILRIQSAEGTKRIEVSPSDTTCQLFERIHSSFELSSFAFAIHKEKNSKDEIISSKSKTLRSYGLRHGDMLYLSAVNGAVLTSQGSSTKTITQAGEPGTSEARPSSSGLMSNASQHSRPNSSVISSRSQSAPVVEDDVDLQLLKMDGKIERKRDDKLCRHNTNSRCFHCSALEPYDDGYLKEQKIKHLSFHSYLRKMTSGVDRGKFLALEDISCRIRNGCKDHPPWPRGICSKCQPNAITLNRQVYRHIDNVTFENTKLVERFLNYWRTTGHQRVGFLYGTYDVHADVPLGLRANVAAIYEPPQDTSRDSIRLLLPDEREELVEELAAALGLKRVGWIFTDLIPEDVQKGTVKHNRHIDTHFLSAQECIMAGHFQTKHGNPCRWSSDGTFGSKFVTVCVTGDKTNQVHMEGYQVSNQCMALVRDNCLLPTKDASELGYVRESTDKQYVPDVYYKEKDTYGNEVSRLARPLPVEYLLLDVPASTPLTPHYTFNPPSSSSSSTTDDQPTADRPLFPVENRMVDGHLQDFAALSDYMTQCNVPPAGVAASDGSEFLAAISDFHLLLFIATMEMLPMRAHMAPLLRAVREGDAVAAAEWQRSEHWATVEQLIAASSPPNSRPGSVAGGVISSASGVTGSSGIQWTCSFCTYLNASDVHNCEMCSLPRNMPQ